MEIIDTFSSEWAIGGRLFGWEEVLSLAVVIVVTRRLWRKMAALSSVLLFAAAFPPWGWPTWLICFTPLILLWRGSEGRSIGRDVAEAVAIGFAMCWMTTGFVRDAVAVRGWLLQASGCLLFGLQIALLPVVLRKLGERTVLVTAGITAAVATGAEWLQASALNGINWSMTALYLPVGHTPLAQWAAIVTPLGVSALLYGVNFLWLPELTRTGWRRWRGPLLAGTLLLSAWMGGQQIAASVVVPPQPFSVMLVQPHVRGAEERVWRPWLTLDRLTRESLERDGPVDLIVWPETALNESQRPEMVTQSTVEPAEGERYQMPLQDFQRLYQPAYQAACLVGVPLVTRVTKQRYGLEISDVSRVNCACLVNSSGAVDCHEKLALVPLKEGLPDFLETSWVRRNVLPYYELTAPIKQGQEFHLLPFSTQDGQTMQVAASVCYESHLPWLPQFDPAHEADAVVHLLYDGDFSNHPEWTERQSLACRYRAIESRTWNYVCSTWSGSAIIDPTGRIVRQLPARSGVLRSDVSGP